MLTASSLPLMNSSNITLRSKESADTMARGRSLASPTTLIPSADPCAAGGQASGAGVGAGDQRGRGSQRPTSGHGVGALLRSQGDVGGVHQRQPKLIRDDIQSVFGPQLPKSRITESVEAGSGQTSAEQGVLGENLIHSPDAGRHPRPCVGYPQYLQQLLDSAVFTPLAVHGDEADVRVQVHQSANQRLIHINGRYLVASSFQGPRNPGSSVD